MDILGLVPPIAPQGEHVRDAQGERFHDPYEWLRDKQSAQTQEFVAAQNAYTEARMAPLKGLRESLFQELMSRVQETDMSVPTRVDGYWYFARTEEGKQYGIQCRVPIRGADDWDPPAVVPGSTVKLEGEEVVFDSNVESEGCDFFALGGINLSRDGRWMLYSVDTHGDERYDMRIRDLAKVHDGSAARDADLSEVITGTGGGCLTPDGAWVFYVRVDDAWRPYEVWRHKVGTPVESDVCVFHEDDERFWVGVGISADEQQIVIDSASKTTSEVRLLSVATPDGEFKPFIERQEGVEYDVTFAHFEPVSDTSASPTAHDFMDSAGSVDAVDVSGTSASGIAASHTDTSQVDPSQDIPIAIVTHNVNNPNFEIDVIDMRSHKPPYTLGEGVVIAEGSPSGCEPPKGRPSTPEDMSIRYQSVNTVSDNPHNPEVLRGVHGLRVDGIGVYRNFVVLQYRANSLPQLAVMPKQAAREDFEAGRPWGFGGIVPRVGQKLYSIGMAGNASYDAPRLRYVTVSYTQPSELHEYNPLTDTDIVLRQAEVLGDFDAKDYAEKRVRVRIRDGELIPVSLVWRKGAVPMLDGATEGLTDEILEAPRDLAQSYENVVFTQSVRQITDLDNFAEYDNSTIEQGAKPLGAMFITGYGAYEISSDPSFSVARLSLLDRGVLYAVVHVRGGGELGHAWYEQGSKQHKINTFIDFIDATAALQQAGLADPKHTVANGGSAGGLLMGAIANMAPQLYAGIEADVPFVDALTSMLDATLPLTVTEWDEWGDPLHSIEVYRYMRRYTPYENVQTAEEREHRFGTRHFPAMFITTSMNDTRVLYVEPLKWLAKLQEPDNEIDAMAKIEVEAGHGGVTGRYKRWYEIAYENAWCLAAMGIEDTDNDSENEDAGSDSEGSEI